MTPEIHCKYSELVPTDAVMPHPKNPHMHPEEQLAVLADNIKEYGWRFPVLVSSRSKRIVAGHARLEAAKILGSDLPVDFQDFKDDAEELAVLVADNLIPELAEMNVIRLEDIKLELADLDYDLQPLGFGKHNDLERTSDDNTDDDNTDDDEIEEGEIYYLNEDVQFSSSNEWGIPDLLPEKIATTWPSDVWDGRIESRISDKLLLQGTNKFPDDCSNAYLGFYVDDNRFDTVWSEAVMYMEKMRKWNFKAVLEPDFSLWRNWPLVTQLWNVYRSRWCARYWQELGFNIIPSLKWSTESCYKFAHGGIPEGCEVVALQCRTLNEKDKTSVKYFFKGLHDGLNRIKPKNVLIYGGETNSDMLKNGINYQDCRFIYLSDWTKKRRDVMAQRRKQHAERND